VSNSIYYPAMVTLAEDLNTTITKISFTITSYMVLNLHFIFLQNQNADFIWADIPGCRTDHCRRLL
jgi:hypothetical protein